MEQKGDGCMSNVYESIMTGLNEAVEDSKSYEKKLKIMLALYKRI